MEYVFIAPSTPSTCILRIPRLVSPNLTMPSISVTTAGADGLRASNNSVTLGKPPVISRVLHKHGEF